MKISTKPQYVHIQLKVDRETKEALALIARREGISVGQLTSDAIHWMLIHEAEYAK